MIKTAAKVVEARPRSLGRQSRLASFLIFAAVVVAYFFGFFEPAERALMDTRFRLLGREATGELVVVTIDARSLGELSSWPWPRRYHAEVIDRLLAAGARAIALDIDLSATTNPADDDAMAAALARAGGRVILPAFAQAKAAQSDSRLDYTFPQSNFRAAAQIGAVNVFPEPDSLVRRYARAISLAEADVPSTAALLSGQGGADRSAFYIDFGITPASIPTISYVDVLNGRFDRAAVSGKRVLIGASAIELGDQFAAPVYSVVAGPMLQALAFESLSQDRALRRTGIAVTLGLTLLALTLFRLSPRAWGWRRQALLLSGTLALLYAAALALQRVAPVSLDTVPPATAVGLSFAVSVLRELEWQARMAAAHRLSDARQRALMDTVLRDSFDGIIISRADGTIELANAAATRILGVAAEQMIGRSVERFLPGSASLCAGCTRDEGNPARRDVTLDRIGASAVTIEQVVSLSPVRPLFIHTFRDISDRKAAEEKLRGALQEALDANRTKTEFLATMSHELRTPLNAIIGFSEMIHSEMLGALPDPRYRAYAADIGTSGRHLLDIINDILDIAKIEAGRLTLNEEEVDLRELVARCVKLIDGRRNHDGITLRTEFAPALPPLRVDRRLVSQIVVNLLSNAVKFTASGGVIVVSAMIEDGAVALRVSDTGIGIPADVLPRVSEPFFQVDSGLARKHEGTGLGLALVSAFAKLHDARLHIESVIGEGTTVTVSFPAARTLQIPERDVGAGVSELAGAA